MQVRYRYRIYPTPRQQQALARVFGCARVVYNDWRKGPTVRHPKPRRKRGRQSIRLTRHGFALHGERLYVAKVGDIRVEWSRALPSVPSSVTVIRDSDGRYYASFVVERAATPLPVCDREVGLDLGLASLVVTSDGERVRTGPGPGTGLRWCTVRSAMPGSITRIRRL